MGSYGHHGGPKIESPQAGLMINKPRKGISLLSLLQKMLLYRHENRLQRKPFNRKKDFGGS